MADFGLSAGLLIAGIVAAATSAYGVYAAGQQQATRLAHDDPPHHFIIFVR